MTSIGNVPTRQEDGHHRERKCKNRVGELDRLAPDANRAEEAARGSRWDIRKRLEVQRLHGAIVGVQGSVAYTWLPGEPCSTLLQDGIRLEGSAKLVQGALLNLAHAFLAHPNRGGELSEGRSRLTVCGKALSQH